MIASAASARALVGPDPLRWPDVAHLPVSRVRAAIAGALLRRIATRLPLRIALPDGRTVGDGDPSAPTLWLVRPEAFRRRVGVRGLIGFGEAYQAGDWETDDLPRLLGVFAAHVESLVPAWAQRLRHLHGARHPRTEENTVDGARRNIHRHYDLSNELFALFLDDTMSYSSALFETDTSGRPVASAELLPSAQHRKIDRLLDATDVGPGTRLLEIGTGWGELAIRAAQRGARVHTVTISTEQRDLARQRDRRGRGRPDRH